MRKDIFSLSQDRRLLGQGERGSGWKAAHAQGTQYNGICKIQMVSDSNLLENVTDPKITHYKRIMKERKVTIRRFNS